MELSFSMPPCCFPAVLLVQGIIARMQSGTAVQSQHGPVQCLNCWSRNLGQRHLKGSAKVNCGLPALLVTPDMNSGSLISSLFNYFVYLRYPYLWSADDKFLSETRLGFGNTYQLMFGEEMLFLSKNSNFPVSRTLKQQWVGPDSTDRASSKVSFVFFCKLGKICGVSQPNSDREFNGRLLVTTHQRDPDLGQGYFLPGNSCLAEG